MRSAQVTTGNTALATDYNNLRKDAYGGSELLVHEQSSPNMTVAVEAGVAYVGATRVIYAGGNSPSITNPVTNPRIDLITIDSAGTIGVTAGSENASPVAPTYPANKLVLAEIYLRTSGTTIRDTDQGSGHYIKNDVRPFLGGAYIATDSQVDAAASISFSKLNYGSIGVVMTPDANGTRDFGTTGTRWNNGYFTTLYGNGANITGLTVSAIVQSLTAMESITAGNAVAGGLYLANKVSYDNKISGNISSGTQNNSFTVGNNANRVLVLVASAETGTGSQPTVTATYNGVAFTITPSNSANGGNSNMRSYGILVAPATGANTLSVTFANVNPGFWAVYSLYNANQSTTADAAGYNQTVGSSSITATATSVTDGAIAIGQMSHNSAASFGTGSGNAYASNTASSANTGTTGTSDLTAVNGGGTVYTMTVSSISGPNDAIAMVVCIAPASAAAAGAQKASSAAANQRSQGFIGFAQSTVSAGQSVVCTIGGVVTGLTGIQAGVQYYLNDTQGTIGTSAGSVSRKIGIGLSATTLLITNIW